MSVNSVESVNPVNKDALKDALVAHLSGGVDSDLSQIRQEGADARGDEQIVEDASAVDRSDGGGSDGGADDAPGDLHALLQRADAADSAAADKAKALSTAPCDTVQPGAVVEMDGHNYVVGVASTPFMFDGALFAGISTSAPVYSTIEGLRAGATFSYADGEHHIGAVS